MESTKANVLISVSAMILLSELLGGLLARGHHFLSLPDSFVYLF